MSTRKLISKEYKCCYLLTSIISIMRLKMKAPHCSPSYISIMGKENSYGGHKLVLQIELSSELAQVAIS